MKDFANLFKRLETSNKTTDKVNAMVHYFECADEKDKLWLLALFTGKRPKRPIKTTLLKEWAMEITQIPEWLFLESYSNVGDLGETIALLLPENTQISDKPLHIWMEEIKQLSSSSDEDKKRYVIESWNQLNVQEKLLFNKLIGGSFRIGVSDKLLIQALAKYTGKESNVLLHSIIGKWEVEKTNFETLINNHSDQADNSKPYPFCLAYPIDDEITKLGNIDDWVAEYKWDGIRGLIVKRNDEVYIWSRGEELVTDQFPEITTIAQSIDGNFVIDGEILAIKENVVLNFNELQKRLNRKTISKKLMEEVPVGFYAYDLLELDFKDLRNHTLEDRRQKLISIFNQNDCKEVLKMSNDLPFSSWEELSLLRDNAREVNAEGLMLKNKNSVYHTGRKRGDWWKWKVDPLTIDAVLIYAQKGSGRRSGYYTDFTFAIKEEDKLVTVAKAYSGLTDNEIKEVNKFIRNNSIEKFGPVRTVKPELVFEIAFEGIGFSNRHKSGIAVRFPRISRWRKDKTVHDIDTIESVKALIQ